MPVVVFALLATTFGQSVFAAPGAYNIGSYVTLFCAPRNVLVTLHAKTLLGQPLGSNLYPSPDSFHPLWSFVGRPEIAATLRDKYVYER